MFNSARLIVLELNRDKWTIKFRVDARDEWTSVLDAIKDAVPFYARRYVPSTKVWEIEDTHIDALAAIFPNFAEMKIADALRRARGEAGRYQSQWHEQTYTPPGGSAGRGGQSQYDWFNQFRDEYRNEQTQGGRTGSARGSAIPDATAKAFAALHLLPDAPPSVVKAARKALALLYHPDINAGDLAKMQLVNASFDLAIKWSDDHTPQSA